MKVDKDTLKILKHNIKAMRKKSELYSISDDWDEGYQKALDEMKEQIELILDEGKIEFKTTAFDEWVAGKIESLETFGGYTELKYKPWLAPAFERCKEEIHEQLKESIEHSLEQIAEKRLYEDIPEKLREIADELDES